MATLQDVRAFVRQHSDLSLEEIEAKLAAEFKMTRDEAAQMMKGLGSEDPSMAQKPVSPLDVAVVAGGLSGVGAVGTQNTAGAAVLASEAALEDEAEALGATPSRPSSLSAEMPNPEENSETSR